MRRNEMKIKIIIGSIFAVALIILVSFVSVVGHQSVQTNEHESYSPLFAVRTQHATQKISTSGVSDFLGKGTPSNIFPSKTTQKEELIQTAIKIFSKNPALLNRLIDNLEQFPYITGLISKYGIDTMGIKHYTRMIQNNPSLVTEDLTNIQLPVPSDDSPQPLGLSTSNPLGCFIVALVALIPITVVLTLLLLLFTVRILTCLNVNDCGNAIANQIWDQLIQGLTPG